MTRGIRFLAASSLLAGILAALLYAPARAQSAQDDQRANGTRWIMNYLLAPSAATMAALMEIIGVRNPQTPSAEPVGYLDKNRGVFSPEVIEYYKDWLPYMALDIPLDKLNQGQMPSLPTATGRDRFLSDARTRDGVKSLDDLFYDIALHSVWRQGFDVQRTLGARAQENLNAIDKELRDGDGRFAAKSASAVLGVDGQPIAKNIIHAGDIKADMEQVAAAGIRELAKIQDPSGRAATNVGDPLSWQFGASPEPPRSGVVPGGSNAGPDTAGNLGILPNTNPFAPFNNFNPNSLLPPINQGVQNILNNFGGSPGALSRFGGAQQLANVADTLGNNRTRDLLAQPASCPPYPPTALGPEDPQCPVTGANRARETVANIACLLGVPTTGSWTVNLVPAPALVGIQGTNSETRQPVTIAQNTFPTTACVWTVSSGNDAAFVSDSTATAFRLFNTRR